MAARTPSKWGPTWKFLKVLAGVGAFLTAVTGLIAIFHQVGWVGSDPKEKQVDSEVTPPNRIEGPPRASRPAAASAAPVRAGSAIARSAPPAATTLAPRPTVNRSSFEVSMPAKREYTTGHGINHGRFMLLGATLIPQTEESDLLQVRWRFVSRSPTPIDLRSSTFSLRVSNTLLDPEHEFIHRIAPRESREGELDFVLEANTAKAVLRYGRGGIWEIPLDLAAQPEAGASTWNPDEPGRNPFDIDPPAKKEHRVGNAFNKGTFTLTGAKVTPKTPESDEITIQWRMISSGAYPLSFNTYDVRLSVDGKKLEPEQDFTHQIQPGDTREGETTFVTETGVRKAAVELYRGTVEIPLDVAGSRRD